MPPHLQFIGFFALVYGAGWFHRREHVMYEAQLRDLGRRLAGKTPPQQGTMQDEDWLVTGLVENMICLRRSFHVFTREDLLRYAVPLTLLCLMLILLQGFVMATVYGILLGVKWFLAETWLAPDAKAPSYELRIFGQRIFGAALG